VFITLLIFGDKYKLRHFIPYYTLPCPNILRTLFYTPLVYVIAYSDRITSHPYKRTVKCIVMYIPIFIFLHRDRKVKVLGWKSESIP
jgi:hypothetical protein